MSDEHTRNATGGSGDDVGEMIRRPRLDDRTADALFSGRLPADREDLADVAAFADRLRTAASTQPVPAPSTALAAVLADGLATDRGELPATTASTVATSAGQRSRRRTKQMLELLVAKVAGVSLLAKTGIAGAAVIAGATGAGLTGSLPEGAQAAFDRALGGAPAEEAEETELVPQDGDELELVDAPEEELGTEERDGTDADGARPEVPGADGRATADDNAGEHGAEGRATADDAATDGRAFGERKATEARESAPAERGEAPSPAPEQREDAATPGRERADTAPSGGDDAPAEPPAAPEEGQPEEGPAGSGDTGEEAASSARDDAPTGGRP